jgi:thiamine-phosphate pyrophosphorylase
VTASLPPLYAILDLDALRARALEPLDVASAWLEAGVRLIQLRAKSASLGPMLGLADAIVTLARPHGARIVINDRADVARLSGAAGVHVGQTDLTVVEARAMVGPEALVGLSTHSATQAVEAVRLPVSYVAIGPVFTTTTKAQPDPVVGLAGVRAVAALAGERAVPVVAIGGVTLDHAEAVRNAGASSVAVIADLLVGDPGARARAWISALGSGA